MRALSATKSLPMYLGIYNLSASLYGAPQVGTLLSAYVKLGPNIISTA